MKVVLLNGSPNEKGCTYTALMETARALEERGIEWEVLHVGKKSVPGCMACWKCRQIGRCVLDDQVNLAAEKLRQADGMVIGSPVYFASPNGSLLAFLDRLYSSAGESLMYKPCGCLASARRAGTTAALDALHKYPLVNEQPLVASSYWCQVFGNTPEEVRQDQEGMRICYDLGKNMAWLLKAIGNSRG